MKIRRVASEDANIFIEMRIRLFKELGEVDETSDIKTIEEATSKYFLNNLNQRLICWVAIVEDKIIATASLSLFSRLPYNGNLQGKEGYILNIYTLPEFRKQGVATEMIDEIIDYAKNENIKKLWLNASEKGKKVYTTCGFEDITDSMDLFL